MSKKTISHLVTQLERTKSLMLDASWRTLPEITSAVGGTEAGVSARLRDLRKEQFGGFTVNRRPSEDTRREGMYEYQVLIG